MASTKPGHRAPVFGIINVMKMDSVGTLFANAWKLYKERFSTLVLIFLVPAAIIGVGDVLIARGVALGGLLNFIGVIVAIIASLALISAAGRGTDFGKSYAAGFRLFWPAVWIVILNSLALFGAFTLLIIPGIFLAVSFAFVNYVFVLENKHGIAALTTSKEYIKGYWWAVFGRGIVLGIFFCVVMLFVYTPIALLAGKVVGGIAYWLFLLFFTPFSITYAYRMYENLRRLKPDAAAHAAKAGDAFIKVCMVVGIVAAVAFIIFAAVFARVIITAIRNAPANYLAITQAGITPSSGPVGTVVTVTFPTAVLAPTNTVLMNMLLAGRGISSSDGKTLMFTVPRTLAPNCAPNEACPQFLVNIQSGIYGISVLPGTSTTPISAANFTVTSGGGGLVPQY